MPEQEAPPPALWLVPAGIAIGFVGSLCGIGGGLFAVPLLHSVRGFELRRAVATSLVLVFATTAAATLTEVLQGAPSTRWSVVLGLVPGSYLGARWGFRVAERTSARSLKLIFVFLLCAASLRVLFASRSETSALATAAEHGWRATALSFVVGIGGGFLAPLLGLGGGILTVPGLFLGIPGLGFAAARTASLAAGAVAAGRSLRLHARAGRVAWGSGLRLGVGALLGGAAAAAVARHPGWVEAGRLGLGIVLLGVALRFARDLARGQA